MGVPVVAPKPERDSRSPWGRARSQFRVLQGARWPDPAPPEQVDEAEHSRRWREVTRPYTSLRALSEGRLDESQLAPHLLTYAYRFTRQLALASGSLNRTRPLSSLPPRFWEAALQLPTPLYDGPDCLPHPTYPVTSPEFTELFLSCARFLHVPHGSPPHYVKQWLELEPAKLYLVWPSVEDILGYEGTLLTTLRHRLLKRSRLNSVEWLQNHLGMEEAEALDVQRTAQGLFAVLGDVDPATERGILLERLERYYQKADRANELREVGNALKLHAAVVGLTRGDGQVTREEDADLVSAIKKVTQESPPAPMRPKQLPPPNTPTTSEKE